ncbi:hypothetical protein ACIBG7_42645 [Nonomuraea sp. NPDC050328]|uniref:hypothetical protein n=1 Tax=Nonomuraea sp. NPDC050328 TaxID=3364361 RepID=UPI00378C5BF6
MAKQGLSEALAGLSADDISVDADGRVTIGDPETARKLRDAIGAAVVTADGTNASRCTSNASSCNPNVSRCNPA